MLLFKNKRLASIVCLAAALFVGAGTARAEGRNLPEIQERGVIRIALYNDYPPYSYKGKGIDLDLAQALADKLKVRLDPIWFEADENVDDDLRNMVWKGHYLGTGPADVMIHAPIDPELARRNKRVKFIAPYSRERLEIVRRLDQVGRLDDMSFLKDTHIGVEDASLASIVMLSLEGGRYRERVRHFRNATLAVEAMKKGEVAAVLAQHGEAQGLINGATGYAVTPMPVQTGMGTRQWVLGLAVRSDHEELANALERAMEELAREGALKAIFERHGVTHVLP